MGRGLDSGFIDERIKMKPFLTDSAKDFFKGWSEVCDSIKVLFIGRKDWEDEKKREIFYTANTGEQILLLPEDLRLWEIFDIVDKINGCAFGTTTPYALRKTGEFKVLGDNLMNSGIFISGYLDKITQGKEYAEKMALRFYEYGLSLHKGNRQTATLEEIREKDITEIQKRFTCMWLLGRQAYKARIKKLFRKDGGKVTQESLDELREKIVVDFFKALDRTTNHKNNSERPWEIDEGMFRDFQHEVKIRIFATINKPKEELIGSVLRRGKENIVRNIKMTQLHEVLVCLQSRSGGDIPSEEKNLYDALNIPALRKGLHAVTKTGDRKLIAKKEMEIAKKVQNPISLYKYRFDANYPAEMISERILNCVGATMLGGSILDEIGIKNVFALVPGHAVTILVTSDDNVHWFDMIAPHNNVKTDLPAKSKREIISLAKSRNNEVVEQEWINVPGNDKGVPVRVLLMNNDMGALSAVLSNYGFRLFDGKLFPVSTEACHEATTINPQYTNPYSTYAEILTGMDIIPGAIDMYRRAIRVSPKDVSMYRRLEQLLNHIGRIREAELVSKKIDELYKEQEGK